MSASEHQIWLASRSPRRAELLTRIGVRFVLVPAETDESRRPGEPADDYVTRVALDKARAGRLAVGRDPRPILGADTAVVVEDQVLGKPSDRDDFVRMMRLLSGRTHRVLTAVALIADGVERSVLNASRVTFRPLDADEIGRYWASGEPHDKAGGYAIQGYGALFVAALEGSYSGVMGLPLFETGQLLAASRIRLMAAASTTTRDNPRW